MKMIEASCENGIVQADDVPVSAAEILSQGTKASEGMLFLDDDQATYLTSNAEDIKDIVEKLSDILDKVSSLVASIPNDTIFIPGTGGASLVFPPTFAANKASLDSAIDELNEMKDMLK